MGETVPLAEVTRNFELYQDRALHTPVTVMRAGRPSVVILAADEYERLRGLDRQAQPTTSGHIQGSHHGAGREPRQPNDKAFEELAEVTLVAPVFVEECDRELPAGSRGTVVGIWQQGRAYEVEFAEPFACLVTVPCDGLAA